MKKWKCLWMRIDEKYMLCFSLWMTHKQVWQCLARGSETFRKGFTIFYTTERRRNDRDGKGNDTLSMHIIGAVSGCTAAAAGQSREADIISDVVDSLWGIYGNKRDTLQQEDCGTWMVYLSWRRIIHWLGLWVKRNNSRGGVRKKKVVIIKLIDWLIRL